MSESVNAEPISGDITITSDNALSINVEAIQNDILAMNKVIAEVDDIMSTFEYDDESLGLMPYDQLDANTKVVNSIVEEYENARKSLRRNLSEPYKVIEEAGKEHMEPLFALRDVYSQRRKELQQEIKDSRFAELEQEYFDFAPALANVVPLEMIIDRGKIGYAKNYNHEKKCNEMCEAVSKVASEWESLQKLDLEFFNEAEAEFFRTLSLQAAIDLNGLRIAEQARIDQLKADVEANKEASEDPYVEAENTPEIVAEAESYIQDVIESERQDYLIRVSMNQTEKHHLLGYMRACSLHGTISLAKTGEFNG